MLILGLDAGYGMRVNEIERNGPGTGIDSVKNSQHVVILKVMLVSEY